MKNVFLTALTLSLSLSACTNPNQDAVEAPANGKGIYQGEITPADNLISHTTVLIYIETAPSASKCTGSVLSPTVILTAAHCVVNTNSETQKVEVLEPSQLVILDPARVETEGMDSAIARGTKVIAHPIYISQSAGEKKTTYSNGYDLALIQLSNPLPDSFKPVVLSDRLEDLSSNQIYIAGFGRITLDPNEPTNFVLHHGPVNVDLSSKYVKVEVNEQADPVNYIATNTISTPNISFVKTTPDASICHGDSGGPIYFIKDGEVHLAGVNVSMWGFKTDFDPNCATEGNGYELSVSMAGPSLRFVLDSYKELTGTALSLARDVPEMDPNTFEFHMQAPVLSSKNNIANLEGYTAAIDSRDNTFILIDQITASVICEKREAAITEAPGLYVLFSKASVNDLDGKTVLPVMLSRKGVIDGFVEGRAKLEGEKLKLVVLTVDGYLSAELPVITCN